MAEQTSGGGTGGIGARLQDAIDDLRHAADDASGDVRTRIESALEEVREASRSMATRAQEGATAAGDRAQEAAGDLREQVETFRNWVQGATSELLDQLQAEIDKRRRQLTGGGE
jgi:uncharacterized protein YjbJ (UPF0337 family)